MAFDPMQGFEVGQKIGKSKGSAFGGTAQYMSDLTAQRDKEKTKVNPLELAILKQTMQSPLQKSQMELNEAKTAKLEDPSSNLSVSQQIAKDKRTQALFDITETNKLKKGFIDRAKKSLPNIPGGWAGKLQIGVMKNLDPNNPILADWQNLKSVLMDATLMNIGRTKGAISDKEMAAFQTAAANDDLVSVSRMGDALDRLRGAMDADEFAKKQTYKQLYGEDPDTFLGQAQETGNPVDIKEKYAKALSKYPNKKKAILQKYKEETGQDYV